MSEDSFKQQDSYQQIIEAASCGMIMVDEQGTIYLVNRMVEQMFGYTRDQLLNMKIEQLMPQRFTDKHPEHRKTFYQNPQARSMGVGRDLFGLRADGHEVPIEIGLTPIDLDAGKMVLASIIDISERHILHNKEAEIKKQLEQAVKTQTQEINRQRIAALNIMQDTNEAKQRIEKAEAELRVRAEELMRSNQELEQFAYVASHDLQEPLRMVASYTQLLEKRYNDLLDEKGRQYIAYAVNGAQRMQQLISDLLMFSRVGTKGKEFKETDMNSVYQKAIQNLEIAIQENNVQISCDQLPTIAGDDVQLIQLFQNLIGNAMKFHGQASPQIQVHVQDRGKDWLFSISDNGIGMDEKYKDRVFIIFQRLHTKDQYQGTGIGLAVCKKIVERHEGQIWVESKVGEGATFYFAIPKQRRKKLGEMLIEEGLISSDDLNKTLKKQV